MTPAPWTVFRCESAPEGWACGIQGPPDPSNAHEKRAGYSNVICDTNREECHHMMKLEDAEAIVRLRNDTELRTAVHHAWAELGALALQVGDVIDEEDVRLYEQHIESLQKAVKLLGLRRRYDI